MFQTNSQVLYNPVIEQFASSFGGYSQKNLVMLAMSATKASGWATLQKELQGTDVMKYVI